MQNTKWKETFQPSPANARDLSLTVHRTRAVPSSAPTLHSRSTNHAGKPSAAEVSCDAPDQPLKPTLKPTSPRPRRPHLLPRPPLAEPRRFRFPVDNQPRDAPIPPAMLVDLLDLDRLLVERGRVDLRPILHQIADLAARVRRLAEDPPAP